MIPAAMFQSLLFRPPSSVLVTAMTVVSLFGSIMFGINELRGKNLQYSKMIGANTGAVIPSKAGMAVFYFPSFILCAASLFFFGVDGDLRFFIIRTALTLHFFRRLLETLYVHKFSGSMTIETSLTVSLGYFVAAFMMIYTQYLSLDLPQPPMDSMYAGMLLFLIGSYGNFYHHYLLSTLRKEGEKGYKIPKGGLFSVVICPHYLFEVLTYWGTAFITQTPYAFIFAVGTSVYLSCRSCATRKWYVSKFDDFPGHVKAIIPYVF